ncbi:MAG: hypothetical protein RR777_06505 [Christensenellaceae bacterium]
MAVAILVVFGLIMFICACIRKIRTPAKWEYIESEIEKRKQELRKGSRRW